MTEEREQRIERLYAEAERKNEKRKADTVRRGPTSLIAVCLGVALIVGVTAAIDLRRLQTPRGTALGWTGAAVFGDCTAYRELTAGLRDDGLGDEERCRALRSQTEEARDRPGSVVIEVTGTDEVGERATATVRLELPERDRPVDVELSLVRHRGGWQVERTDEVCAVLPCP